MMDRSQLAGETVDLTRVSDERRSETVVMRVVVFEQPRPIRRARKVRRASLAAINKKLAADPADLLRRVEANTRALTGQSRF